VKIYDEFEDDETFIWALEEDRRKLEQSLHKTVVMCSKVKEYVQQASCDIMGDN